MSNEPKWTVHKGKEGWFLLNYSEDKSFHITENGYTGSQSVCTELNRLKSENAKLKKSIEGLLETGGSKLSVQQYKKLEAENAELRERIDKIVEASKIDCRLIVKMQQELLDYLNTPRTDAYVINPTQCKSCGRLHGLTDNDAGSQREIQRLCYDCYKTNPKHRTDAEGLSVELFKEVMNKRVAEFSELHHSFEASELRAAMVTILRLVPPNQFRTTQTATEGEQNGRH